MGKSLPTKGGDADSHALEEGATALESMQVAYTERRFDPWQEVPAGTHYPGTPFGWTLELGVGALTGVAAALACAASGGTGVAAFGGFLLGTSFLVPLASGMVFWATAARVGVPGVGDPRRADSPRGRALAVRLAPAAFLQTAGLGVLVALVGSIPDPLGRTVWWLLVLASPVWGTLWLWTWLHLAAAVAVPGRSHGEWVRVGLTRAGSEVLSPGRLLRSSVALLVQGSLHLVFEGMLLAFLGLLFGGMGIFLAMAAVGDLSPAAAAGILAAVGAAHLQVLVGRLAHVWSLLLLAAGGAPELEADARVPTLSGPPS